MPIRRKRRIVTDLRSERQLAAASAAQLKEAVNHVLSQPDRIVPPSQWRNGDKVQLSNIGVRIVDDIERRADGQYEVRLRYLDGATSGWLVFPATYCANVIEQSKRCKHTHTRDYLGTGWMTIGMLCMDCNQVNLTVGSKRHKWMDIPDWCNEPASEPSAAKVYITPAQIKPGMIISIARDNTHIAVKQKVICAMSETQYDQHHTTCLGTTVRVDLQSVHDSSERIVLQPGDVIIHHTSSGAV